MTYPLDGASRVRRVRTLLFFACALSTTSLAEAAPAEGSPGARAAAVESPSETPRVRAAIELAGGYFDLPRYDRVGGGLTLVGRIGAQLTESFAIVYQAGLGFLHVSSEGGDTSESYFGGTVQSSVLLLGTFANVFDVGAGPAGDVYFWGGPFGTDPSFAPGGHVRLAAHVLGYRERFPALTIGWDQRATALVGTSARGPAIAGQLGVGIEWY